MFGMRAKRTRGIDPLSAFMNCHRWLFTLADINSAPYLLPQQIKTDIFGSLGLCVVNIYSAVKTPYLGYISPILGTFSLFLQLCHTVNDAQLTLPNRLDLQFRVMGYD